MAKKAKKKAAKKSLKLRKKPVRDLPAKKKVKAGVDLSLSPSQLAALPSQQTPTFAPPYVPVGPLPPTRPR